MREASSAVESEEIGRRSGEVNEVEEALRRRLGSRIGELRVCRVAEGLLLCGYSHSYYDKQIAQHMAMEMTAMQITDNRIEVRYGAADVTRRANDGFHTHYRPLRRETPRR
jgi:hypothetical protein